MNFSNGTPDDEMSMEDILSSIRRYVSEENEKKATDEQIPIQVSNSDPQNDRVIKLDASHVVSNSSNNEPIDIPLNSISENPEIYQERSTLSASVASSVAPNDSSVVLSKKPGPFEQLTNALNSYGKRKTEKEPQIGGGSQTVDQFFTEVAERTIQKWIDANMETIVEKIVMREIEKIKSE